MLGFELSKFHLITLSKHDHMSTNLSHHARNVSKCFGIREQLKPVLCHFFK